MCVETVFTTIRTFTVLKYVLPTHHLSHLINIFTLNADGAVVGMLAGRFNTCPNVSNNTPHCPCCQKRPGQSGQSGGWPRKHPLPTTTPVSITTQPRTDTTPESTGAESDVTIDENTQAVSHNVRFAVWFVTAHQVCNLKLGY